MRSHRRRSVKNTRRYNPRFESLERRNLLATLGIDIRFLEATSGPDPAPEISGPVLRGASFTVDVRVQDIRDASDTSTNRGIIALPLDIAWDNAAVEFKGDANLSATGNSNLPLSDPLVTSRFPLQRAVDSFNPTAGPVLPDMASTVILENFNLRCVRGGALPAAGFGQEIGATTSESFSRLPFVATTSDGQTFFTVHLDGSLSFADAAPLDAVVGISPTTDVAALTNTVTRSLTIVGGSISGMKFDDANGNGMLDGSESGVAGITMKLTPTTPPGTPVDVLTDTDGNFIFDDLAAGSYFVSEVIATGRLLTTPANNRIDVTLDQTNQSASDLLFGNFTTVTLEGIKFIDSNGNGIREPGEAGQPNVTIQLDLLNDGTIDREVMTGADGSYQFTDVGPGMHAIGEVVPPDFEQTAPMGGRHVVTTISGQDVAMLDFGNRQETVPDTASIAGVKFDDINGNGMRELGEPGRGGVTIRLDLNNDGSIDRTTTTDTSGNFIFENLPAGTHSVSEIVPDGSIRTTPSDNLIIVTVTNNTDTGNMFGNFQLTDLGGNVFNDANRNGLREAGESGRPGVTVRLDFLSDGDAMNDPAPQVSDALGNYAFNDIGPGSHTIIVMVLDGFDLTSPATNQYVVDNRSGASRTDLDFGLAAVMQPVGTSSISGFVYNDVDRDGQFDSEEVGLPGVTVQLFLSSGSTPVQTAVTSVDGGYQFKNLPSGSYRVVELQPERLRDASITLGSVLPSGENRGVTLGQNGFDGIVLADGDTAIDYNFGEIIAAATKRFVLSDTNVRSEMASNIGTGGEFLRGTTGDDTIVVEHFGGGRISVSINNAVPCIFTEGDNISIDALGGNDNIMIIGSLENETFRTGPSQAVMITAQGTVGVFNARQIEVIGGGGSDTAVVRDSTGSDQLIASGNTLRLDSIFGSRTVVTDVDSIQATSPIDVAPDSVTQNATDYILRLTGDWLSA